MTYLFGVIEIPSSVHLKLCATATVNMFLVMEFYEVRYCFFLIKL